MELAEDPVARESEAHHEQSGGDGVAKHDGAVEPDAAARQFSAQMFEKVGLAIHGHGQFRRSDVSPLGSDGGGRRLE